LNDRARFLRRKNLGRLRQADALADLSAAFGRPIRPNEILPLEEGDRLRSAASPLARASLAAARAPGFSTWAEHEIPTLQSALAAAFGGVLATARTLYLPVAWDFLGPVAVNPTRDFARAVTVARRCAEECALCSVDASNGLWLQFHASDAEHGERYPFHLLVWGAEWQALALKALPFELSGREA
jgi:hypothetical protein